MNDRCLSVGQWLGTHNKIVSMRYNQYGWVAMDGTGTDYRQPDFPGGLKTWDEPTGGKTLADPTPWPENTE